MADVYASSNGEQRINPGCDYEIAYWSRRFGVSPQRLREILSAVGSRLKDVQGRICYLDTGEHGRRGRRAVAAGRAEPTGGWG